MKSERKPSTEQTIEAIDAANHSGLPPTPVRYGVAVVAWFASLLVTLWLAPHLTRAVFLLFWPSVIASGWFGGRGPSLLVVALSLLSVDYYLLPPIHGFGPRDWYDVLTLLVFAVLASATSELTTRLRVSGGRLAVAERIARARAADAAARAAELAQQVEAATRLSEDLQDANQEMESSAEEAEEARAESEEGRRRLQLILESLPDGAAIYDEQWRWRSINPVSAVRMRLAGKDPEQLIGKSLWEEFPVTKGTLFESELLTAVRKREVREFEQPFPALGGWLETRCVPLSDGAMVLTRDISERKRIAEESARQAEEQVRATQREHFLAEASRVLSSSLDYEATIASVARLAVPTLADWCSVELLNAQGVLEQLAVTHVDPDRVKLAGEMRRRYPTPPDSTSGAPQVVRTGKSEFIEDIPDAMLVAAARDDEHLRILREVGLRSVIIAPIAAPGAAPRGALVLVTSAESGRVFTPADVALAEELARRAALAVEHAVLFRGERAARAAAEAAAERITRLQAVTTALSTARTIEEVCAAVTREGTAAFAASESVACLLDDTGEHLIIVDAVGVPQSTTEEYRVVPVSARLPMSDAVRNNAPIFLESRSEVLSRYPGLAPANVNANAEAWMTLPLAGKEGALGALAFGFVEGREFTADDRELALALSRQCAIALERAKLFETEKHAREEAENANRAKTDFLAVMSHELRTPLNAIAGHTELIELGIHGPVTPAQDDALMRIKRSQRHLLGLINDVLNFAKLEAGHVEITLEAVSIPDTIRAIEPLVSAQIRAKALRFSHEGCVIDQRVRADAEKLRQILLNLLSNAIKFTPDGGAITLDCTTQNNRVAIAVRDTGIGIPADRFETIFEPFVQINRAYTSMHEGTGLGLAISRDLALAMSGELSVTSTEGQGSVFTLTLPAA